MAIIKNVQLSWVFADPERPRQYQGKGRRRWSVNISTTDKKESELWKKEYGFKVNPVEVDGRIVYSTKLTRNAFRAEEGSDGQVDDMTKPEKPVEAILINGAPVDPNTVGNGSVGDVSFRVFEVESTKTKYRSLKGICVRTYVYREPFKDEDRFEIDESAEVTVVRQDGAEVEDSLF